MNGRKTDEVVLKHWLEARVGEAIAQLQLNRVAIGSKIPYSDVGFTMLQERVQAVLAQGVTAGHFVDGSTWVQMPTLATVPLADRQRRRLSFRFGAEPTGAVEDMEISGYVTITDLAGLV